MKTRNGFTLIELLVVIAIIAILAAILFPVFAKAREKAREISCISNEKQMGLAFMQYIQDNDEKFPAAWDNNRQPNINWGQEIYPYVKSLQVFACPSNTQASLSGTMSYSDPNGPQIPASYAMNADLGFLNGGQPNYGPYHAMAGIDKPSQKILVSESAFNDAMTHWPDWWACGGSDSACSDSTITNSSNIVKSIFAGHTGFVNVVYVDGHAKSMRPVNLVTPVSQFGQVDPVNAYPTSDPNCYVNPTDPVVGANAINCDAVNPSAVADMSALSARYQ